MVTIGLIGFGEAGYYLTTEIDAAASGVYAYDMMAGDQGARGEAIRKNAAKNRVTLVDSLPALAEKARILLCLTSAHSALPIAKEMLPHLTMDHIYSDLNSASPATKEKIGEAFRGAPAAFVEAAVMASVPANKTKVLIYVCGDRGRDLAERLNGVGMNVKFLSEKLGSASAMKMLKSVLFKGFIAILTETVFATDRYGITEDVLQALKSMLFEEMTYEQCCNYFVGTMATHSKRLGYEMEEVLGTLDSMGENSVMTRATLEKMRWITAQGYNEKFQLRPDTYEDVLVFKREKDRAAK